MEENKNPLMGHVVKVPAQVSGIPDGVQMTVNAAVTTFAAVDGKPAGIESMGTAECNMLASYTRGTVSFSVHGEKPVMVSVRLLLYVTTSRKTRRMLRRKRHEKAVYV